MKKLEWNQAIISAYITVFKELSSIISGILSFGFLSYLIGYVRAQRYYSRFGAEWIVSELSTWDLIGYSIFPILVLFISFVLTLLRVPNSPFSPSRFGFYLLLIVAYIIVWFTSVYFHLSDNYFLLSYTSKLPLLLTSVFLMAITGDLIVTLTESNFKLSSTPIIIFSLAFFAWIFACRGLGADEGEIDSHYKSTTLPTVVRIDSPEDLSWRLLYSNGNLLYLTQFCNNCKRVDILNYSEVDYIYKN